MVAKRVSDAALVDSLPHFLAMTLVLVAVFAFVLFGGCVVVETMGANSYTDSPPNVFQWDDGRDCACQVLEYYGSVFFPE